MRKSTAPFDALARSGALQDWIKAFQDAVCVRIRFVPGKPNTISPLPHNSCLRAPIVVAGEQVATLRSGPVRLPRARIRGQQRLLNLIAQHLSEFAARYVTANGKHNPTCVACAKEYIQAHLADKITLSDVAKQARYSPERFRKRFRKFVGMPLGEYLSRARVEKAKELMADPHQRATEVCFMSGFQSIPSFNRVFKQLTGLSPTEYRASLKAGPERAKSEQETTADE